MQPGAAAEAPMPPNPMRELSEWTLTSVTDVERPLLARLLQLYLHDFCDFDPADVDEEGKFSYRWLPLYGTKPGYHAQLLRVRGQPAGFALVEEAGADDLPEHHYVAEFFVIRGYRQQGYGTALAVALFERFPGKWWIEEIPRNTPAQSFWRRVIDDYTGGKYTDRVKADGKHVQEFDTANKELP